MLDPYLIVVGLTFFLMLTVLVAAHEYGHYIFARMFGMEVEAFALMLGGVRKTDLKPYLRKPIVSGWVVAGVAAALILAWDFLVRTKADPVLLYVVQATAVFGIPLWIISRITALYHAKLLVALKWVVIACAAWLFVLRAFGALQGIGPAGLIPLMTPITALAVIFTYYMPVAKKEEEHEYGHGQIFAGEEAVPVRFRPLWSRTKNGTEYSLLVLPFGGFAKIKGMQPREDGSEISVAGGFFSKPPWQRLLVLFAGPLFSVLAGIILLFGVFATVGIPETSQPIIGSLEPGYPAEKAGLRKDDRILSLDGKPMAKFTDMIRYVSGRAGKEVDVQYLRSGQTLNTILVPVESTEAIPVIDDKGEITDKKAKQGRLGIRVAVVRKPVSIGEAATTAVAFPFQAVGYLASRFMTPTKLGDEVGGIAQVAAATDAASREGIPEVLQLAAGLSISLGIFNLLPIYPLDGGQMMVALMEMLRRGRRLSMKVQGAISSVGLALILMLVMFVLVNDTKKLSGGGEKPKPPPKEQKR
ncbi:MAG: site-2 protease family protein [Fimbriimonadaceae bacterium]